LGVKDLPSWINRDDSCKMMTERKTEEPNWGA
jgi:hypothetical protein